MNEGLFTNQYGAPVTPMRVRWKVGQGNAQVTGEALVLATTDVTQPMLRSRASGAPAPDVVDLVIQVPYAAAVRNGTRANVGAIMTAVPDGTLAGGNRRGVGAVDFQSVRNAATQVASGDYSFAAGGSSSLGGCTASGAQSVAMGANAAATGAQAICLGTNATAAGSQAVAFGLSGSASGNQAFAAQGGTASGSGAFALGSSTADGNASHAIGAGASARTTSGSWQFAGSQRSAVGDRNIRLLPVSVVTTNATPTVMTTTGGAEAAILTWVLPNNSSAIFSGWVIARNTTNNDSIGWKFEGMVSRDGTASTVALLGSVTPTTVGTADASMSSCTLAVGVNTTNGSLIVTATGIAATTIAWNGAIVPAIENA